MKYILVVIIWNGAMWTVEPDGWSPRVQPSKVVCEKRARVVEKVNQSSLAYCVRWRDGKTI